MGLAKPFMLQLDVLPDDDVLVADGQACQQAAKTA